MKTLTLTIILATNAIIGQGQNLISNSSFEDSTGQLNCQNWYDYCERELTFLCDTVTPDTFCGTQFYQDAPLNGGNWCIQLFPGWLPSVGSAETYLTGLADTNIFVLRVWMKWVSGSNPPGMISIGTISQNQITFSKTITDNPTAWTQYILIDTMVTQTTDSIVVYLSAGGCPVCGGSVLFDLIELTVNDTLTSINSVKQEQIKNFKVYPNPFRETITIEILDNHNENHTLTIYSSLGQAIKTIQSNGNIFSIDSKDIADGLYFYKVQNTTDKKIIGQGKFVKN